MKNIKSQVIQLVESMPENVTIDDIMAGLYFMLAIDTGLCELDEGKGIPHATVKERMAKWIT